MYSTTGAMEVISKFPIGLLLCTLLSLFVGDGLSLESHAFQYDDIVRNKVIVAPDGSTGISGLYTRVNPKSRWPGGILYWNYNETNTFTVNEKARIATAIDQITTSTCVRFVMRTNETAWVSVQDDKTEGCWSALGYTGGRQPLNFGTNCVYNRGVIHEFMHALGFEHEMTRYDRDMYMEILWPNIEPDLQFAFDKQPRTLSYPKYELDFRSIMMYTLKTFNINSTLYTIKVLNNPGNVPEDEIGLYPYMTDTDVARIQSAYKCPIMTKLASSGPMANVEVNGDKYVNFF